jgi:phosphoribosyl 1,2-cyclic phosphate phosphodiesterase
VVPLPAWHGELEVFGYRIGGFAVLTDVQRVPGATAAAMDGLDLLVLSGLRYRPHPTHFSLAQAAEFAVRIGARRTLLTHVAHDVDHGDVRIPLPPGVEIGHDGLVVDLD